MGIFRGLLFVCFAAAVAFGQSNQAAISGVVSDSQGLEQESRSKT
jgi:hypothetical protein